jgi:AcrR family transcriptional regulator
MGSIEEDDDGLPADPRTRLIRAGMQVIDELPLGKVFAGASAASIAERAGATTGSFFHHFANVAEFTDAIVLDFREVPHDIEEGVGELVEVLDQVDLIEMTQAALVETWRTFNASDQFTTRFRRMMMLWAHQHKDLAAEVDGLRTVGDVLRENYTVREAEVISAWGVMLERAGRKLVPPFTIERVAVSLTAIFQGLVVRHSVDPDRVDDELFSDVMVALLASLTVPLTSRAKLSDFSLPRREETQLSPQARVGARRRKETRDRIVGAAAGMFHGGWESVAAADIADRAGVSTQTVFNLFTGVRAVAANTFATHYPSIRSTAVSSTGGTGGTESDPLKVLRGALARLSDAVLKDPGPARALLEERLDTVTRHGRELADNDIRLQVPLAEALLHPLAHLDLDGEDPLETATTLINFVLAQALGQPDRPERVVDLALRLLPRSALTAAGTPAED